MSTLFPDAVLPGDAGAQMTTAALLEKPRPPPAPAASQRLEASRARLRAAMRPPKPARGSDRSSSSAPKPPGPAWSERLASVPIVGVVAEAIQAWWQRHPLRTVTLVLGEVSRTVAVPLARKNPVELALIALVGGALLMWSRPQRWLLRPALFAGLLPHVASRVIETLPFESWLNVLGSSNVDAKRTAKEFRHGE